MRILSAIFLLLFLGVVGIFAIQNLANVQVRFLNWGMALPLATVVVGSYLLGMASGWSVIGFLRRNIHRMQEPRT